MRVGGEDEASELALTDEPLIVCNLRLALLSVGLFCLPWNVYLLLGPSDGSGLYAPVYLFECFFLATIPLHFPNLRIGLKRVPIVLQRVFGALFVWTAASVIARPSLVGSVQLSRMLLIASVAVLVMHLWSTTPGRILLPLAAGGVLQGLIVLVQWVGGGPPA